MNFSGTVDDTLRYIVASNNVVLEAFPSDTYSASLANGILTLTINCELHMTVVCQKPAVRSELLIKDIHCCHI